MIADITCSVTTIRCRRDEWIEADIFTALEQCCLDAYEKMAELQLEDSAADGASPSLPAVARLPADRRWAIDRPAVPDLSAARIPVVLATPVDTWTMDSRGP